MIDKEAAAKALAQAVEDSRAELANNPNEATGCCTISSAGWSEQKAGITKAQCDRHAGPGVTVKWAEGSC